MSEEPAIRRRTMQAVKSKDTSIELKIRRILHGEGYRYRLHRADLPGCPDMVFASQKKVLFIHGCFWHGHDCPRGSRVPKTNIDYWTKKISRNRTRDEAAKCSLETLGWNVFVVWECELLNIGKATRCIRAFLNRGADVQSNKATVHLASKAKHI